MSCFNVLFNRNNQLPAVDHPRHFGINIINRVRTAARSGLRRITQPIRTAGQRAYYHYFPNLDLSDRQLTVFHLENYPFLRNFDLSFNLIPQIRIPENCHIEHLDLYNNQLEEVDLPEHGYIERLNLASNQITELHLSEHCHIQELDLSNNQLSQINFPPHFDHIARINLNNNELTWLPNSILSLPREAHIFVRHNPFHHQYIQEFTERLEQHRETHPGEGPVIQFDLLAPPMEEHQFIVDLDEFAANPKSALRHYLDTSILLGTPPIIRFSKNKKILPGYDVGGLTRDFVTQLFDALRPKENGDAALSLKEENGLYFPIIPLPISDSDRSCYQAIGMIYALALNPDNPDLAVRTGQFFHPVFFEMLHSLTEEMADWMPDDFNTDNADTVKDQIPSAIYNQLLAIYAKKLYSNIFSEEELHNFIHQGTLPEHIIAEGFTFESFTQEFNTIILPTLIIAKSMRHFSVDWADVKEISAEDLQEHIQGQITAKNMIHEIQKNLALPNTPLRKKQDLLVQWLEEMEDSEEMLKKLCRAASGSPYLHPLRITNVHAGHGPIFHTCFRGIDFPNYPDYESFKESLNTAIDAVHILDGFDIE